MRDNTASELTVLSTIAVSSPSRLPVASLKGWRLYGVLAVLASAIELFAWNIIDWRSGSDIRLLIGFNWRLSALYFLLTFSASALQKLFPSALTRWLLANRRYLGLAFASVAGWQLVTIAFLATHFGAELADIHSDSFQYVEDLIFVTLMLMTVTSFRPVNRHMTLATWRRLHSTGIYLLAGLFTVNFLYAAVYTPDATYTVIILAFAIAWALRAAVWWQRRTTFTGWKLFWALSGVANAAVLGTWSYFGLQSDAHLRYVTDVCVALAGVYFLAAFLAPSLNRLWPTAAHAQFLAGRWYFLLAGVLPMTWYLVFMAVRARKPALPSAPPLPLTAASSLAMLAVALVLLAVTRVGARTGPAGGSGVPGAGQVPRILAFALVALLTSGLLATRREAVSAGLVLACFAAWGVTACAALRTGPGLVRGRSAQVR